MRCPYYNAFFADLRDDFPHFDEKFFLPERFERNLQIVVEIRSLPLYNRPNREKPRRGI